MTNIPIEPPKSKNPSPSKGLKAFLPDELDEILNRYDAGYTRIKTRKGYEVLRDKAKSALQAREERLVREARIQELENLPVGLFDSTPYRDERLAALKKEGK